jgi:hypothetical protein
MIYLEGLEPLRFIETGLKFKDEALNTVQRMYKQFNCVYKKNGLPVPSFFKNRFFVTSAAAVALYKLIKGRRETQRLEQQNQTTIINNYKPTLVPGSKVKTIFVAAVTTLIANKALDWIKGAK